jgi:hypothetical protein
VIKRAAVGALVAAVLLGSTAAGAQTFRFEGSDGTVHYTNAPTDPAYRRMGFAPPVVPGQAPHRGEGTMLEHVRQAAARYGVPERLVTAVIRAESGFNPRAVSPKGARGLMQLMPQTASLLGVRDSFDPEQNIDGGVRHLRGLIDRFANNLPLALAAYNAGENAVTQYGGIPPYAETQGYVTKVLSFFEPGAGATASPRPAPTVRFTDIEGTIVYTNVPPPASARLRR